MLCPEVSNFPPPKVITTHKQNQTLEDVIEIVNMNSFYKGVVITCPDELQTPCAIEELVTEDTDYYKVCNCSVGELIEVTFIENFVKKGLLHCLSADRNCIIDNSISITPDGILTLHVLDYIFQTLGFEGVKRPYNYYEVTIDLRNLKQVSKIRQGLSKLELFHLFLLWEPFNEDVCPSSIAKYFHDRQYKVSVESVQLKGLSPSVKCIPSTKDVDVDEMVEWIGMLALEGDITQEETYISTYSEPESEYPIASSRVSILIGKGLFTPTLLKNICRKLNEYVTTRELPNYWVSLSIQSFDNSLWKWSPSSPRMFQTQDCSITIFFTHDKHTVYSVGQLKYT
ncbi:hypothetical protein K1T71_001512 [Dendrolimus kikuchii]|uniref:Uncharacterized protein n=1 Tax=Dendrolimus kikuchii TaxID=765133 RepID=A0ACC1DI24_9NEOP|nr:hypothetical protein K1T71_001512 [Dendrolimus kikuchii]